MPRPGPKKQCYHPPTFTNQAKAKAGSLAQRLSLPIPNSVAFFNVVLPTGHQAVPEHTHTPQPTCLWPSPWTDSKPSSRRHHL